MSSRVLFTFIFSPLSRVRGPSIIIFSQTTLTPVVATGYSHVLMWDLGGSASLRSLWSRYYQDAHGIIFVVDASAPDRFDEARHALGGLLDHPDLTRVPILLYANKQDLPNAVKPDKIDKILELSLVCRAGGRPSRVQPCSALAGDGIDQGMKWIVDVVVAAGGASAANRRKT